MLLLILCLAQLGGLAIARPQNVDLGALISQLQHQQRQLQNPNQPLTATAAPTAQAQPLVIPLNNPIQQQPAQQPINLANLLNSLNPTSAPAFNFGLPSNNQPITFQLPQQNVLPQLAQPLSNLGNTLQQLSLGFPSQYNAPQYVAPNQGFQIQGLQGYPQAQGYQTPLQGYQAQGGYASNFATLANANFGKK